MAQSRLEKIGTIFTRAAGLLRCGAVKHEDRPIWYDVYAAFPPFEEPRYDRPEPNVEIRKIFYEEDAIRAHFHKKYQVGTVRLLDSTNKSHAQQFIEIYKDLKAQGPLDEEKIFETAYDLLKEKLKLYEPKEVFEPSKQSVASSTLLADYTEAKKQTSSTIDIKDIFNEK